MENGGESIKLLVVHVFIESTAEIRYILTATMSFMTKQYAW